MRKTVTFNRFAVSQVKDHGSVTHRQTFTHISRVIYPQWQTIRGAIDTIVHRETIQQQMSLHSNDMPGIVCHDEDASMRMYKIKQVIL